MNPFPLVDPYMQTTFGDIPSFPIDMTTTGPTADGIGWPSIENDLISNITISQPSFYSSPNMMDNQQAQIVMMMMQQQQQQQVQQQQQQQQYMLLQQQHLQNQLLKRASPHQVRPNNAQQQPPHWFLKQQQAKMMAAQEKLKNNSSSVPSPTSYSASSSPMHSSPLLDGPSPSIMMSSTPSHQPSSPLVIPESDLLSAKRVEVILTINQELIRLCLEHQQMNMNELREPDITVYKSRLQSNLTYLATMADISMTKPEENFKIPTPPNLSPLPPPYTLTGQRIHKLLFSANQLFICEKEEEPEMSPYPQKQGYNRAMMMHQRQQQYSSGMNSVGSMSSSSSSANNNMLSPRHLHHALLKNNQTVDNMQQINSGMNNNSFIMDDTAMMMMMYNA